jgi:predicted transcriptional regulator
LLAEAFIGEQVRQRIRKSGRTNVSRAVSELVQVGFVRRHYQGYRVDHPNRGAQRQAVYTITDETRRALSRSL